MPIQNKDYLLRMIEQLGEMVSRLVGEMEEEDEERLDAVDRELREVGDKAGLNLDLADQLDPVSLEMMYAPMGEPDLARSSLLAELLYLRGQVALRAGAGEIALRRLRKAEAIFHVLPPDHREPGLATARERLEQIATDLGSLA